MLRHIHRIAHKGVARLVDDASFGAINFLHFRKPPGRDFPERLRGYIAGWAESPFADYYRISDEAAAPARRALRAQALPGPGDPPLHFRVPSPLPGPHGENNHASYDLFPCAAGRTAPTLLLTHGLMSVSDIGYRMWAAKWNARGWNVVFVHLPYHYARKPAGSLSGEFAVTADLVRTVEGARQAVIELRLLVEWLAERGSPFFAMWGTSYGAWITALLACVEPRLDRAVLIEPIVDIQASIWESPACAAIRRSLRRLGVTPEQTAPHLRLCCPLHAPQPLPIAPEHVLLLAGEYDRVAPPPVIRALHERWPGSHYHAFPQGHVGYRLLPESFRLAGELWPDRFSSWTG